MSNDKKGQMMASTLEARLEDVLSLLYCVPMGNPIEPDCIWGGVPVLHGKPGIGKTARVKQSAKKLKLKLGIVELGGRQPEDASGAPFLTKDDQLVIACILGAANEVNAAGRGVLFLDEVNWARPATQGAFLSMVWDRRIGDTQFSNYVRVVMAMNPPGSAGGGNPLIPPMANRCFHFEIAPPSDEEENEYLLGTSSWNEEDLENSEKRIVERWADEHPRTVGQMVGFKRKFPQYKLAEPKAGDPQHHKAWPSPRARENAIRAITTTRILKGPDSQDLQDAFMMAACGEKCAIDWAAYRAESDLPDPIEMLRKGYRPDRTRIDRTMAACSAAAAYVINRPTLDERKELALPMWEIVQGLLDNSIGDIGAPIAQALIRNKLGSAIGGETGALVKKLMVRFGRAKIDQLLEEK
jgi:MoxR-like ATPase